MMPNFLFNDGMLETPSGWEDKTVVGLSFPKGSATPLASFTITRESLAEPTTLAAFVDRHLVKMAQAFPQLRLLHRRDLAVSDLAAVQIEFTWQTPDKSMVHQQQTVLITPSNLALIFTGTTRPDAFAEFQPTFQSFLQTLRLR